MAARRFGAVAELIPERVARYRELHANAWPAVNARIKASNIQNYSIFLRDVGGKPHLFSYFEYVGKDFDADMAAMAADKETQRWWAECVPCMVQSPGASGATGVWSDAVEVYHLD
jgi:L-rhamnose mutarotase